MADIFRKASRGSTLGNIHAVRQKMTPPEMAEADIQPRFCKLPSECSVF